MSILQCEITALTIGEAMKWSTRLFIPATLVAALAKNDRGVGMKPKGALAIAVATLASVIAYLVTASGHAGENSSPVYVTEIPAGYRDWKLISVAHEEGNLHSFAIVLGNDVAIKAYREGKLPFPDGAIIAALHYSHVPSEENNKVFGDKQSFVPGPPTNVQFEVKNSKKYASTGGWGFGHFNANGKPADEALLKTCFPCHEPAKASDLVYTHYTP
jgi:hypothetical protein